MKTLNFEQLVNALNDNNIRFGAITKDGELIFSYKGDDSKTWHSACLNELSDLNGGDFGFWRIWETAGKKLTVMDIHPIFESEEALNRILS